MANDKSIFPDSVLIHKDELKSAHIGGDLYQLNLTELSKYKNRTINQSFIKGTSKRKK